MIIRIANILSPVELQSIQAFLLDEAAWLDGKASAGGSAKAAKANLQLSNKAPGADKAFEAIATAISKNAVLNAAARPEKFVRIMINRYDAGMRYGNHVDAAYIDETRTDLSFTLFLTEPATYEGGELIVEEAGGWNKFKLPAGHLLVYPSKSVHRVEEVRSGVRLAAVGWVKSRVRSPEHRANLFELEKAISEIDPGGPLIDARQRLANLRNNLLRMWGD